MQENPCLKQNSPLVTQFCDGIKAFEKSRKNEFCGEIFYAGHLAQCERRILYRAYGTDSETEPVSTMWNERSERHIKEKWIKLLSSVYSFEVIDENFKAADAYYNLTANVDCIVRIDNKPVVVLIRSLQDYDFYEQELERSLIVDIMMQMWLLEIKDGLIVTENRNNLEYKVVHVIPYNPIISSCKKKCMSMLEFKMYGKMPERPYDSPDSKECCVCEFSKTCWKQKEEPPNE